MGKLFRDLTEQELQQALFLDTPGAETEYSFRSWLQAHPEIPRHKAIPSWGELCVPSPSL